MDPLTERINVIVKVLMDWRIVAAVAGFLVIWGVVRALTSFSSRPSSSLRSLLAGKRKAKQGGAGHGPGAPEAAHPSEAKDEG